MVTYTPPRAPEPSAPIFREHHRGTTVKELSLSHLSIEVGHFYMKDLENGEEPILAQFKRVKPWLEAAKASAVSGGSTRRVSTCFLIDDYFHSWPDAPEIMEKLLRLSDQAGVTIDYVARESACARRKGPGCWKSRNRIRTPAAVRRPSLPGGSPTASPLVRPPS